MTTDQEVFDALLRRFSIDRDKFTEYRDYCQAQVDGAETPTDGWGSIIKSCKAEADVCAVILTDLFGFIHGGANPKDAIQKALDNTEDLVDRMMDVSDVGISAISHHVAFRRALLREHLEYMENLQVMEGV